MFSGIWKYLVAFAVGAAGIAAIFFKGKSMGGKVEKAKQLEKAVETRKKMDAVPDRSRSDASKRLRKGKF